MYYEMLDNEYTNLYNREQNSDRNKEIDKVKRKKTKSIKKILIIVISLVVLLIAFILIYYLIIKKKKEKPPVEDEPIQSIISQTINPKEKLEGEPGYSFKTEVGQLNIINVNQKYTETTFRNGKNITTFLDRKTFYNIYVISETESNEEKKHLYSKIYTCAVSISSECISNTNENCKPRIILNLLNKSIPNQAGRRNLEDFNFENIPVPLCLFNITNHNAITSITCHKSIPERKIKGIILDLYFFRPPGVKRVEKEKNNITISIQDIGDGKSIIREINGGRCEEETGFYSFCSTDFNATKDSEGNLLAYDELCFTNIKDDELNYYIKTKETHLIDITDRNDTSKPKIYKEKMDIILEKINPFMKYYEQVSDKQFEEIYDISINGKLPEKKRDKLDKSVISSSSSKTSKGKLSKKAKKNQQKKKMKQKELDLELTKKDSKNGIYSLKPIKEKDKKKDKNQNKGKNMAIQKQQLIKQKMMEELINETKKLIENIPDEEDNEINTSSNPNPSHTENQNQNQNQNQNSHKNKKGKNKTSQKDTMFIEH